MSRNVPHENLVVGKQKVWPPLALAPMVGLSHSALRSLEVDLGGVGIYFTEMLAAARLPKENEKCSALLIRSAEEAPLFYQLFLANDNNIEPIVEKLHQLGAHGVDLNLGCPAPKLRKQGAGCFLTQRPKVVQSIVAQFRKLTNLPLSVKIRLGDTLDEKVLVSFCQMLEGEGIDLLTVHGRLHAEKFCRKPRWDWIGKVKKQLSVPVFANGGIFTVEDARKCLEITEADGLMIGRGAAVRPWIFADIAKEIYGISLYNKYKTRKSIYMRFVELLTLRFAKERRLGRLKQFTHYFAETFTYGHHFASVIQSSDSMEQAEERALRFFEKSVDKE